VAVGELIRKQKASCSEALPRNSLAVHLDNYTRGSAEANETSAVVEARAVEVIEKQKLGESFNKNPARWGAPKFGHSNY
jgi:hypothetical protein